MNSITDSFVSVFDPESSNVILTIDGHPVTLVAIIVGAVVTVLSAISIIGGIQRISKISVFLDLENQEKKLNQFHLMEIIV